MSDNDAKGYYARLGVDPAASADAIKASFRRLAKELHPDKNRTLDAKSRFQAVNEAYETLGDQGKRAAYDGLRYSVEPGPTRQTEVQPILCSKCGKVTAQPRYIVFLYVISVIVVTDRHPIQGTYCATCARNTAFRASLITAVAGWWGFPFGPIYSVSAIFRNAIGGLRLPSMEPRMLWYNAVAFYSAGNLPLAYALARKVRSASDEGLALSALRLMDRLQALGVSSNTPELKNPWHAKPFDLIGHFMMLCVVPLSLVAVLFHAELTTWWTGNPMVVQRPYILSRPPMVSPPSAGLGITAPSSDLLPTCAHPPSNGKVFGGYATASSPGHMLEIRNGSGGDAIVKVRDAFSGHMAAWFFVADNSIASFRSLPDGSYRIQYAFGSALKEDCHSFTRISAAAQFPDAETLKTTYTDTSVSHVHLTYTLYPVPSGNVLPQSLDAAAFDAE